VGTGYQNTIDIENGCTTPGTAADICANLVLNGYNDWYLPSSGEFELMVETVGPYRSSSGSAGLSTHPIIEVYYWTSSQYYLNSSTRALRFNMDLNNFENEGNKATFWSTTERPAQPGFAYYRYISSYYVFLQRDISVYRNGHSVRLVKD
jgi:uncharacterized protein (TIGR02145 family)